MCWLQAFAFSSCTSILLKWTKVCFPRTYYIWTGSMAIKTVQCQLPNSTEHVLSTRENISCGCAVGEQSFNGKLMHWCNKQTNHFLCLLAGADHITPASRVTNMRWHPSNLPFVKASRMCWQECWAPATLPVFLQPRFILTKSAVALLLAKVGDLVVRILAHAALNRTIFVLLGHCSCGKQLLI